MLGKDQHWVDADVLRGSAHRLAVPDQILQRNGQVEVHPSHQISHPLRRNTLRRNLPALLPAWVGVLVRERGFSGLVDQLPDEGTRLQSAFIVQVGRQSGHQHHLSLPQSPNRNIRRHRQQSLRPQAGGYRGAVFQNLLIWQKNQEDTAGSRWKGCTGDWVAQNQTSIGWLGERGCWEWSAYQSLGWLLLWKWIWGQILRCRDSGYTPLTPAELGEFQQAEQRVHTQNNLELSLIFIWFR